MFYDTHMIQRRKTMVNSYTKPKRSLVKWIILSIVLIVIGIGIWIALTLIGSINKITQDSGKKTSILSIFDAKKAIKGQTEGRTNILLLGYGGSGHAGGGLSDTIEVLSIRWSDNKVAMISVPRDLWVNVPGYGYSRINAAYSDGNLNSKVTGGGEKLASNVVSEVLGIPIHYCVAIDFNGFVSIVNAVGGVDINVENTFTDYSYPKNECNDATGLGCSLMTVHFDTGIQHMDGARALIYSRSRHSIDNNEGSDFARSRRQQLLMLAIKEKMLSLEVLANPLRITSLLNSVGSHLKTNLQVSEIKSLSDEIKKINTDNIATNVIDNSPNGGVLKSMTTDAGADVQIPKKGIGNYADMQKIAKNIFDESTVTEVPELRLEVLNATGKQGIANQFAQLLKNYGYNVTKLGNYTSIQTESFIYNCAGSKGDLISKNLASTLKATVKAKSYCANIDIQIVLGQNNL